MSITYTKLTALAITRTLRNQKRGNRVLSRRCELKPADPSPNKRWSRARLDPRSTLAGLDLPTGLPLSVAARSRSRRVNMKDVGCTVHGDGLPEGSFVDLGCGVAMSGPELLFVEMGSVLGLAQHLMLGHELCGGFSRDAANPRNGDARMKVAPVTSVAKIAAFLHDARGIRGQKRALRVLGMLSDNAWSPTESVVATMACLPLDEFGYGLGKVTLNKRIATPEALAAATDKSSRVPDILFDGTSVGINYDGAVHLNLDSVVEAAMNLAERPGESALDRELEQVLSDVRAKVVDDIMRNRELAADGLTVFPVVKEDLYREGGLDGVMLQVIQCIEDQTGRDLSAQRKAIALPLAQARRQELLRSLIPGKGARAAQAQNAANGEVVWEYVSGI